MRVCDACSQPIDPATTFVELVGPSGQRHYHDGNGICWQTVTAAIDDAQREARRLVRAAAAPPSV